MKPKILPFEVGDDFCTGASPATGAVLVSSISGTDSCDGSVGWTEDVIIGSVSWGVGAEVSVDSVSLSGGVGPTSFSVCSRVGLPVSFLLKKPPKSEFLLFGFGALSRLTMCDDSTPGSAAIG